MQKHLNLQVRLLSAQFLLGMAVNEIGLPQDTQGFAHTATIIFLGLHVVVALSLLINSMLLIKLARPYGKKAKQLAMFGAAGIVTAMLCGILTLTAPLSGVWSYLMAVAFLAVFGFYGYLLPVIRQAEKKKTK